MVQEPVVLSVDNRFGIVLLVDEDLDPEVEMAVGKHEESSSRYQQ